VRTDARPSQIWRSLPSAIGAALAVILGTASASAVSIELNDVAPDRIERQRAAAEGRLPLPGTPSTKYLNERLAGMGLKAGAPVLIRIFKASSELEVWMERDGVYVLFATYPICHWSGTLGPKLREGDKQTPEGFYTLTSRQLYRLGRWPFALNLGFPNAFDRKQKRDGSYILLHGGCSSVGCVAMTEPVIAEVYGLVKAALRGEQRHVPVHVFPFRMTEENMAAHRGGDWAGFWANLKEGYDSFERTRRAPRISVCEGRYRIEDASPEPEAQETADSEGDKKRGRKHPALGAIREACPEPAVASAGDNAKGPGTSHMSRLGGPLPERRRKRHRR
jgi:murein L,D-transpeptidase YafK